jgi:hypothetical protein
MIAPRIKASGKATRTQRGKDRNSRTRGSHKWIADLAEPYLRGYEADADADEEELAGYWFAVPRVAGEQGAKNRGSKKLQRPYGFFVGYMASPGKYSYLNLEVPECVVFAWFAEPGGAEHVRLVAAPGSLLRKTHTYIGWLTHRPPRFALYTEQFIALVRHRTMRDWPEEKREHYSRNFFIETLAWLVRSGLVRKLKSGEGSGLEV